MPLFQIPLPSEITARERKIAMGSYLTMFVSLLIGLPFPIVNIIASIIYFLLVLDANTKTSFTRFHAMQSLISQLCISLLNTSLVIITLYKLWQFLFHNPSYIYTPVVADIVEKKNLFSRTHFITETYKVFFMITIVSNILYFFLSMIALIQAGRGRIFSMPLIGYICKRIFFKATVGATNNSASNSQSPHSTAYPFYE